MNNEMLLTVAGLSKSYPVATNLFGRTTGVLQAVDNVDLEVRSGETLSIVGESGCGKTTLGRSILRLEKPDSGTINFEGVNLTQCSQSSLRSLRRHMQMIFQDPYSCLNPRKTVGRIIGDAFVIHNLYRRSERRDRVAELLELVGMRSEHMNRYPHEFSGGQRQRIGIAQALALNPKLIIADEPVSALDVSVQAQVLNLLVELQTSMGLTYIFISHDLSVVRHISDRVAVMYLGRIVELADAADLFAHPRHPYTRALVAAVPRTDGIGKQDRIILSGDVPSAINPPQGCHFHPRCYKRQPECLRNSPTLRTIEGTHKAACHFPE